MVEDKKFQTSDNNFQLVVKSLGKCTVQVQKEGVVHSEGSLGTGYAVIERMREMDSTVKMCSHRASASALKGYQKGYSDRE